MSNAARHAGARTVVVALRRGAALHVEVRDDGGGVDPTAPAGVGVRSMRECAEEVGGTCDVRAARPGTAVVAALPLPYPAPVPAQRDREEVPA